MAITVLRCFEYQLECDNCGEWEVVHTGDGTHSCERIHDLNSARRACNFHTSKGMTLCDECFKNRKEVQNV